MDSTDNYLTLLDSLSSTLRQGWLDLAIARQSMGASRINGALLDHKSHSAATSVQVDQEDVDSMEAQPRFSLLYSSDIAEMPQLSEEKTSESGAQLDVDDQIQKERAKLLSMFGTLISPKLRAAQLSFETALETLVEIANMRSAMLSSFDRVRKELDHQKDDMEPVPSGRQ
ncbi:COILED-COIL DOMAIN-CONTAINING PROTEIN 115 [Salix purpurea]|uniref:Vacuolar ATPase assembly protein VMA22 n=1 Tax=Salix purpurea TaxID=77065 RepID=A0A9Q0WUP3_SALPP|nr:COILED-COIL DOMAIN-CONTAINING PROTEIN 115 [Salix purpurea]